MTKLEDMRRPEGASMLAVLLYITVGLLLWGLHLTIVYAAHTAICALAASPAAATATVAMATVVMALPLALILFNQRRLGQRLGIGDAITEWRVYDGVSFFVNLLSLMGILWSGLAVMMLSSCALSR